MENSLPKYLAKLRLAFGPTRVNLMQRRVLTEAKCLFCDKEPDTVEHALLDCPHSRSIWLTCVLGLRIGRDRHDGLRKWQSRLASSLANDRFDLVLANFDGAWDKRHDHGGIGVVVRDANGNFVAAMARHPGGIKSPMLAKCMATREAAAFAQQWVRAQVELEGDALLVVAALQRDSAANMGQLGHVLDDTRQLMDNIPHGKKRNKFLAGAFSNSTGFSTTEPAVVFRGGGALHDGRKMAAEFVDQAAKEELEAEFLLGLCW
ncbi:hypothetical protein ACFX2J_046558 [Malus domestica]